MSIAKIAGIVTGIVVAVLLVVLVGVLFRKQGGVGFGRAKVRRAAAVGPGARPFGRAFSRC